MSVRSLKKRGFTLIELLVVISIIGILASFIVASFTSAQQKARDARRKSDLDAIKKALELAKSDSPSSAYYPACSPANNGCNLGAGPLSTNLVSNGYIKQIPSPPTTGALDVYWYHPTPQSPCAAGACTGYWITAHLENANDPTADTGATHGTSSQACGNPAAVSAGLYYVCNY